VRDVLHVREVGEVFVVATISGGVLVNLQVSTDPPTFRLADNQIAMVAKVNGGHPGEPPTVREYLTVGSLVAHCAQALGMDTGNNDGPYDTEALAETILGAIEIKPGQWLDTFHDSRTRIGDRLLVLLGADSEPDPDQVTGAVATALNLDQPQGDRLVELLRQVALGPYCEGCERRGLPLNQAFYCPDCIASAVAAGEADRVGVAVCAHCGHGIERPPITQAPEAGTVWIHVAGDGARERCAYAPDAPLATPREEQP
jgi:hypothetical protein